MHVCTEVNVNCVGVRTLLSTTVYLFDSQHLKSLIGDVWKHVISMPRNWASSNIINWFIWSAQNEKFVWGSIGVLTILISFTFPVCDLNFVPTDLHISNYQLFNSVTHEEIGATSLVKFSGLKKNTFFKHCSIDFVQDGVKCFCFYRC